jgi:NADH-quinone oxidoreductase subunit J
LQICKTAGRSSPFLIAAAGTAFLLTLAAYGVSLTGFAPAESQVPDGFGNAELLGKALYLDYFFPFEAVILIFLVAIVGVLHIGKKGET